jgi:hypothetical protein
VHLEIDSALGFIEIASLGPASMQSSLPYKSGLIRLKKLSCASQAYDQPVTIGLPADCRDEEK